MTNTQHQVTAPGHIRFFGYAGPCGRTYVTHNRDGWLVHYEDKGSGWGRRAGDRLTRSDADHLAYLLAWGE